MIRLVAAKPSSFGICTSMVTMSGRRRFTISTASSPSAAWPTTSISSIGTQDGDEHLAGGGRVVDDHDADPLHRSWLTASSRRPLSKPLFTM